MRRNDFGNGRGGPLMTDHLQDLELELELLKRKRQLIQQQQNEMLYRNPAVSRPTYSQPPQMFESRYSAPQGRNFSSLYDEQGARAPRQRAPAPAPKRRAPAVWADAGAAPEPFTAPQSPFKRPRQGLNSPAGYFNQSPNPMPMPSLLGAPKPLLSLPHGNRRQPPPPHNAHKQNGPRPYQQNFRRNFKPTPNRASVAPPNVSGVHNKPFKPVSPQIKQERKEVVLSATVEPSQKVNGRLELALGSIVKEIKKAHGEAVPLFAFPTLARLMKKGIRERMRSVMVGKVVGAVPTIVEEYRKTFPPKTDVDILELASMKTQKQSENAELAIKLFEEGDPEQYFKKNLKRLLEVKLDEIFEKAVKMYNGEGESEILEHLPEIKKSHQGVTLFKKAQENVPGDKQADNPDQVQEENVAAEVLSKDAEYAKWISMYIEWRLPRLLPKYKDHIIRLLDLDKMYGATKAAIITNSNNKALISAVTKERYSINSEPSKDDPVLPRNLPYFVKVQAVPTMPKRKQMQEFLNAFKPKTIKRHKKNYNLLFVGFADKADYDKILQAHQSKIGTSTINIVGNTPKPSLFDADNQNANDVAIDEVLTPQLDDQINDLLSSIRKADEEAKEKENETDEKEATEDVEIKEQEEIEDKAENGNTVELEAANSNDSDVEEVKTSGSSAEVVTVEDDDVVPLENDVVAPLKSDEVNNEANNLKSTPAKSRAPATPCTIRTRRASRLAQNN